MSQKRIAIIGSGMLGSLLALELTKQGHEVNVFEKGPQISYPHTEFFNDKYNYLYENPKYILPSDLKNIDIEGSYDSARVNRERAMVTGGSGTHWFGIALRMQPEDFATKTLFGFGNDWPITYDELEPYYCQAEHYLGVSGTDKDNPFAPPRSQEFPLPAFELSYGDQIIKERLKKAGIVMHTTPQARVSRDYQGRPACKNFGACEVCPIGARYSPNFHLEQALLSDNCKLYTNVSVRRVLTENMRVKGILYQHNDSSETKNFDADVVLLTAGALESTRILLLSQSTKYPNGIGNSYGQVGKNFSFHHIWYGNFKYQDKLYPDRIGPVTGQSHQFCSPKTRGQHGGVKIELVSYATPWAGQVSESGSKHEIMDRLSERLYWRPFGMHAETNIDPSRYVTLSSKRDRFGDPWAKLVYDLNDFDNRTYQYVNSLCDDLSRASEATVKQLNPYSSYDSGAHHMGGCVSGKDPNDSVIGLDAQVHDCEGLYVFGGASFPSCSGPVNPTLTMLALAFKVLSEHSF